MPSPLPLFLLAGRRSRDARSTGRLGSAYFLYGDLRPCVGLNPLKVSGSSRQEGTASNFELCFNNSSKFEQTYLEQLYLNPHMSLKGLLRTARRLKNHRPDRGRAAGDPASSGYYEKLAECC